jgi:Leucine-rich repeat (LRR) protein
VDLKCDSLKIKDKTGTVVTITNVCNVMGMNWTRENLTLNKLDSDEVSQKIDGLYLMYSIVEIVPAQLFEIYPNLDLLSVIYTDLGGRIDDEIFKYASPLSNINLQMNGISGISENAFKQLVNLTILNLSVNQISELPDNVFQHNSKLEHINLNRNNLSELSPELFKHNPLLIGIYLRSNKLSKIPYNLLESQSELEFIYLSDNNLETLPINIFKNCTKLNSIHLNYNRIKFLSPITFLNLDKLENLFLVGNRCINEEFYLKTDDDRDDLNLGRCYDNWYKKLFAVKSS